MKLAIHLGAGNIGRGLIGSLLSQSGYYVCFVDVDEHTIWKLSQQKSYTVRIVGEQEKQFQINHVDGLLVNDPALPDKMGEAELITCAVGPSILEKIADTIIQGLEMRMEKGNHKPLYIIACENMIRASSHLRSIILSRCSKDLAAFIESHVKFPDCAVDNIIPVMESDGQLTVTVEPYHEWCIESTHIEEGFGPIQDAHMVEDLQPYLERKLFIVNTAHSYIAWLGYQYQHETIYECMQNDTILTHAYRIGEEAAQVLTARHRLDSGQLKEYIETILNRFKSRYISDTIVRVGRSPIRKLSRHDRIIGPLGFAMEFGSAYQELLFASALAMRFYDPNDSESVRIHTMLKTQTPQQVFTELSSIDDADITEAVGERYHHIKKYL